MSSPALQLRQRLPRLADAAVDQARLTVVPRRRVRAARMPFVTLVSLVLLGGIVGLLCFNTQMQQASFAATSLEAQSDHLAAREQTLHDELQDLRSPQNLAVLAQGAGMVAPASSCTVRLAEQTASTGCTAADALSTPTLWGRPPRKPPILDPAPTVVSVEAAAPVVLPPTGPGSGEGRTSPDGNGAGNGRADTARR